MDLIKTQLIESVFAGGGEMGARMRALDWSSTVLGPVDQWPQSLRVCVRVMLSSGYPMLACWGRAYTMLYNDAYATLIGTRHPAALGCSKREVLPEAWDYIGPRFDRVMTHGQDASQLTDQMFTFYRNNYLEECYFSFSYSPIRDDNEPDYFLFADKPTWFNSIVTNAFIGSNLSGEPTEAVLSARKPPEHSWSQQMTWPTLGLG
jgi:hypothetical protein